MIILLLLLHLLLPIIIITISTSISRCQAPDVFLNLFPITPLSCLSAVRDGEPGQGRLSADLTRHHH